jgi:predicted nucleotidyltransferase
MRFGLDENTVHKLQSVFAQHHEVEEVIIYGSRAMGTHKPGSDIDLAVKGAHASFPLLQTIRQEIDDLFLPFTVDLSSYDQITHYNLLDHISRVGQVFYRREAGETGGDVSHERRS